MESYEAELNDSQEPSETTKYLSWSALSFIKAPPHSFLKWPLVVIGGLVAVLLVSSFFVPVSRSRHYSGNLVPLDSFSLVAPKAGRLEKHLVASGSSVKAGQALIRVAGEFVRAPADSILLRKWQEEGAMVKESQELLSLSQTPIRWALRIRLPVQDLTQLRAGMETESILQGAEGSHLGSVPGRLVDWIGQPDADGLVMAQVELSPNEAQKSWLERKVQGLSDAPVITRMVLERRPASVFIKEVIFGAANE